MRSFPSSVLSSLGVPDLLSIVIRSMAYDPRRTAADVDEDRSPRGTRSEQISICMTNTNRATRTCLKSATDICAIILLVANDIRALSRN